MGAYLEGYGYFTREVMRRMVAAHPEHQFIFLFDRPGDPDFVFASNVTPVVIGPPARHPLLWYWWYQFRIPSVLRKYRADVFFSPDGFCSLRTRVPQCLVVHDLAFLHYPDLIPRSHLRFYKKYTPAFVRKATTVLTVSEFSKRDIVRHYGTPETKIAVAGIAARDIFQPVDDAVKESVRDRYAGGRAFFFCAGAIHPRKNLKNLLKAFSIFKKRQQSSMKLLLAGRLAWQYDSFVKDLGTYKYRDDVVLTGYLPEEELARVMASAHGLVYPSLFEGFGLPVIEAMQCGVPVVTSADSAMEEICGDAALFARPDRVNELAEQIMRLYKDEALQRQLVAKGFETAARYSWDKAAATCWEALLKTVS